MDAVFTTEVDDPAQLVGSIGWPGHNCDVIWHQHILQNRVHLRGRVISRYVSQVVSRLAVFSCILRLLIP